MEPQQKFYSAGRKERRFGLAVLLSALIMTDSLLMFGFSLGVGLGIVLIVLCSAGYLISCGKQPDGYTWSLLGLSAAIALSFGRSDDYLLKLPLTLLLLFTLNLAACLMSGQNLRNPGRLASLLDSPRAFFPFGWGKIGGSIGGLFHPDTSEKKRASDGLVLGLVLAAAVLAVLIPLLVSADAAFEGLMAFLPKFQFQTDEIFSTLIVGGWVAIILYTQALALVHEPKAAPKPAHKTAFLNRLTVNTVVAAVGLVYVVFLVSQLAYFTGGFAGLLPEGYTPAEYARRGFFEMAWICAINLGLIVFAAAPVKEGSSGKLTKGLSLFIGLFSLFLVASAGSRMGLYIREFGLTRLRVLTAVFMLWLAVTTVVVCLWLYLPKLPYMKVAVLSALLLGGAVSWVDVDTQVAKYNVEAYTSGQLSTVDVAYLYRLSSGAVPYMADLLDAQDPQVVVQAKAALIKKATYTYDIVEENGYSHPLTLTDSVKPDLRNWSYGYSHAYDTLAALAKSGRLDTTAEERDLEYFWAL